MYRCLKREVMQQQQQQQQQQQRQQQLDFFALADRDRLTLASPPPRTRALPTVRQPSVNGARPRPISMPMAPLQYVPAGGGGCETHAPAAAQVPLESSTSIRTQKPLSSNRVLGDYTLRKTLGAGGVDKIKLAYHNLTDEKVYQYHPLPMNGIAATAVVAANEASKEASKETRTMREAALSMLLHHSYIFSMRELLVHTNYYYMVIEYVNGGQILDHIISHGCLRERVARSPALDYCHRNDVVHRDLKI
ncbi:kinase-like domain-containing protein [Phellopilus nigrolimitatus]|nr:kinase-like domain-containing protein [Phellopilus nigrolimitatus]